MGEPPTLTARVFHRSFQIFSSIVFTIWCPLSKRGTEHIPAPPFIICSNHSSHMDSAALMYASEMDFSKCGMVAAYDYFFQNKHRRNLLSLLINLIPANRDTNRQTLAQLMVACQEFLSHDDRIIVIYPEGTRSLNGELDTFKKGAAMIATELNIPILPAYIDGAYEALPKSKLLPKPKRIRVCFGAAIYPNTGETTSNHGKYNKMNEELIQSIRTLHDQVKPH